MRSLFALLLLCAFVSTGHAQTTLKPGDTVKVPNVLPFKIEDLHEGFVPANPAFAATGSAHAKISPMHHAEPVNIRRASTTES